MGSALVFKKYIFKNQQNKLFVYSILILLPFSRLHPLWTIIIIIKHLFSTYHGPRSLLNLIESLTITFGVRYYYPRFAD